MGRPLSESAATLEKLCKIAWTISSGRATVMWPTTGLEHDFVPLYSNSRVGLLSDLPIRFLGSIYSLKPPLQRLGDFNSLNEVRQCKKCSRSIRRLRDAPGCHPI